MVVGQLGVMVSGMTPSPAGWLPQFWVWVVHGFCVWFGSIVGVSLLAMAVFQATSLLNVPPSSRASSLLQGIALG
ncbi:hypothetical protein EJA72_16005 [Pseudomonas sp. PB120]|nr:hypothetical protein [Pseudomonas sp. PB120]